MEVKIAKSNIRKQVGGGLLSSILAFGKTFLPTIGKTLGLLAGAASKGASQVVKKISGGAFIVPRDNTGQLIAYKQMLTEEKKDIYSMLYKQVMTSLSNQQQDKWEAFWRQF